MEKLRRVQVEGFLSIRSLDITLNDLTVLVGANGSGKSNFVSFFSMLNFILSESLQIYVGRRGGGSSILYYGPQHTPVLRAELQFEDDTLTTSTYGFKLVPAVRDTLLFADEYVEYWDRKEPKPFTMPAKDRQSHGGQLETKLIGFSRRNSGNVQLVSKKFIKRLQELSIYHFHDTSEDTPMRASQDIDRNRNLMSNGGNLAAFLYMLRETKPLHYDRILSTVRLVVPYLREFVLEPDRLNTSRIQLRWRDRNPDLEFGAHQLSDGSLRAIALITALLQPEEMMPGLILIDEPELGLHPSAITLIGSLIKTASVRRQIIVATQSPRLLSEFAPEDVVVVERKENESGYGESVFQRLSHEDLGDWLNDYSLGTLYEMEVTGGGPQ